MNKNVAYQGETISNSWQIRKENNRLRDELFNKNVLAASAV